MKFFFLILSIFFSLNSHAQHWQTISYVLDSSGKEVAKKLPDSRWNVSDSLQAIQSLYAENQRVKAKYELALAILKLLDQNGNPIDKQKYFAAVKMYNNFKN